MFILGMLTVGLRAMFSAAHILMGGFKVLGIFFTVLLSQCRHGH